MLTLPVVEAGFEEVQSFLYFVDEHLTRLCRRGASCVCPSLIQDAPHPAIEKGNIHTKQQTLLQSLFAKGIVWSDVEKGQIRTRDNGHISKQDSKVKLNDEKIVSHEQESTAC